MAPPPPSVTMASAGSEEGDQSVKHEQTAPTVLAPFGGEDMEDAGQEDGECYEGMGEMEESEDLEDGAVTPTPHSLLAHTRNNTTTTTKSTGPAAVVVAQALLALPSQSELKNNNDTPHEPKMASVAASKPPTTVLEKRPALRDAMTLVASPVSLSPPQLTSPTTTNREALFVPPFKASFTRILISALKAYFSGYAVATVPSVVSLIIKTISGGPGTTKNPAAAKARLTFLATSLIKLLTRSFRARLPWFFLVLIGGFRLFDRLFWDIARYVKWKPLDGNTTVMWDGKHRALDVSRRRLSGSPPVVVVGSVLAEEIEIEGVPKAAEEDVLSDTKTVVPGNVLQMEPLDIARSGTSSDVNNTLTAENKIVQLRLQEMQQRQAAKDRDKDLARHIIPPARNILSPTFFAGATASALALLIIEPARRADFALFTLVRAADSLTAFQSHKIKSSLNGWVPPFLLNNMDTAVFVTCCSQIMFCWFFYPEALPRNYVKWIAQMSRMDPALLEAVKLFGLGKLQYGKDTGYAHLVGDYAEKHGHGFAAGDPVNGFISCTLIHCGVVGCWTHLVKTWQSGFLDALKIYIPVHLLPALLFHRQRFLSKQFPTTLLHVATGALRSSTFLATFITNVWLPICLVRNLTHTDTKLGPTLGAILSGFSLLLERKSRRREIGLYCIPKALESTWWRVTHAMGVAGIRIPGGEIAMFAMGMGYLMSAYQYHHKALRPAVRGLLGFFLV